MILLPAIDILDGKAVRLARGRLRRARRCTTPDPLDAARRWVADGARALHVVDLDGARAGAPGEPRARRADRRRESTSRSRSAAACGSSRRSTARSHAGAARVVLGTAAYRDVDFLDEALARARRPRRRLGRRARRPARRVGLDRADRDPGGVGDRAARRAAACAGSCTRASSATGCSTGPDLDAVDAGRRRGARQLRLLGRDLLARRPAGARGAAPGQPRRRDRRQGAVRAAVHGRRSAGALAGTADALQARDPVPRRRRAAGSSRASGSSTCATPAIPVELACRYDAAGADELVFLDITATSDKRETVVELARRTADDVFIPFTIGGGIRSVADAQAVLDAGADKVSVNSAALARPELIDELAATFGAQCVVLAIDAKARSNGTAGRRTSPAAARRPGATRSRWAREGVERGRGRDPADEHGPRRHQRRLRPRADRARSPTRSACR